MLKAFAIGPNVPAISGHAVDANHQRLEAKLASQDRPDTYADIKAHTLDQGNSPPLLPLAAAGVDKGPSRHRLQSQQLARPGRGRSCCQQAGDKGAQTEFMT